MSYSDNGELTEETPILGKPTTDSSQVSSRKKFVNPSCAKKYLFNIFPCTKWIPTYNLHFLQCDIIAGLTVGLTVIPQGLAYAQIAGLPIQYGLYSAFMGSFVYAIFGTSKDITLGPTAIMSLLVHTYGDEDPIQAVVLTLMGGCIQAGMGIFRLGFIMRYISAPVVSGFTSAAALTIGLGQLKHIFGVKTTSSDFFPAFAETMRGIPHCNPWDVVLGVLCICLLLLLKFLGQKVSKMENDEDTTKLQKVCRKFLWLVSLSRNAIIVISAAAVAYAIHVTDDKKCKHTDCLTLTGNITKGLPLFQAPIFTEKVGNQTLYGSDIISRIGDGLLIVPLMGILESLAIGKAFARKNCYDIDVNQEMIAIGVSNIISSFVSSFSITGSFSRTAINSQSGVKTPAGGIVTGLIVLFGLGLLTPLIYYIPKSSLASVIISAVIFMVDFGTVKMLWRTKRVDLLPWAATFCVCFYQIPYGILAGVGVSLIILLFPVTFPKLEYDFLPSVRSQEEFSLVINMSSGLIYPSADYIQNTVKELMKDTKLESVILKLNESANWDYSGLLMLTELIQLVQSHGINLGIVTCNQSLRTSAATYDQLNDLKFYSKLEEAFENGV